MLDPVAFSVPYRERQSIIPVIRPNGTWVWAYADGGSVSPGKARMSYPGQMHENLREGLHDWAKAIT